VLDKLQIFGARAFVLTPPEKRKKLDKRAREACVVGYVDGGKGWMLWDQVDNKIIHSAWVQFADDPLRPNTGGRQVPTNLDPKLLRKEELEDRIGNVLDPALCQQAETMRFVMACELGDFTAERIVSTQEETLGKISKHTKSPTPATPKKYKDILKHPDCEAWLKAIQEELKNLFRHDIWRVTGVSAGGWGMSSHPSFCILRIILHIAHFA
jgi:hypothetical protein